MEFLSVPVEVIDGSILPYLEWNDLLRLRRVCSATKDIADGYLKLHPELGPEIEINEDDKSFSKFLELSVPTTTRIFLNNVSGMEFYYNAGPDGDEFLERLGSQVKHLRVNQLTEYLFGKELDFLGAFVNLESFEAGGMVGYEEDLQTIEANVTLNQAYQLALKDPSFLEKTSFPNAFQQLKTLKIGNDKRMNLDNILEFGAEVLQYGKELQVAALPFSTLSSYRTVADDIEEAQDLHDNPMALAFLMIEGYIRHRSIQDSPGTTSFQVFDFISYHGDVDDSRQTELEYQGSSYFLKLCSACLEFDVKLRNVGPYWFQARNANELPYLRSPDLGTPILSLINLHPSVFPLNIPNLEKIEISATSRSTPGVNWREERPGWQSLRTLVITVDSLHGGFMEVNAARGRVVNYRKSTKNLFKFFVGDVTRGALIELHLKFTKDAGSVAIPKVDEIVSSCPNLRKLTIINWPGTNKALTKLWKGLPGLEEVSLENCKDLGNVAFVGEDADFPVLLKLTKLRKLSLKGLDLMPKITDTLFTLVIRHLRLTHLTLTAGEPVKSVSVGGIRSLLDGRFAETIEKFSFQHWSFANFSSEEFKILEQEFRSYNML